jgi:glutaredoxin
MSRQVARKFLQEEIAKNEVVVFSKSYCPYCADTKGTLSQAVQPGRILHSPRVGRNARLLLVSARVASIKRTTDRPKCVGQWAAHRRQR